MKKVTVCVLFVWDSDKFSSMTVYKNEDAAMNAYAALRLDLGDKDVEEWQELGGKEFRCGETGMIARLWSAELEASLFGENMNLLPGVSLYACADTECDKYEQIRQVGICSTEDAREYVRSWYASQQNYFSDTPEEQGLVKPAEEVEPQISGDFEEYQDYIYSDYGRFGGYYAGVGVKKIMEII